MKPPTIGSILLIFLTLLLGGGQMVLSHEQAADYRIGKLIYENPLADEEDLRGTIIESSSEEYPTVSFQEGRMTLESDVHFLLWFPPDFPKDITVSWNFLPKVDNGLAMFWFCATGRDGEDLFADSLQERTGRYPQYHSGDINAYHLSYFRRNPWDDPTMNTVNLRKSFGNRLADIAPNPIPNVEIEKVANALEAPYRIEVIHYGQWIRVEINDLVIMHWEDDDPHEGGKIGFRQMAHLVAEYSDLRVHEVALLR